MNCSCRSKTQSKPASVTKHFTAYINGYPHRSTKIYVNKNRTLKWHHVLNTVTAKLNPYFGNVKKLYSAESGISINSFTDLENNGHYVASDNHKYQFVEGGYGNKCAIQPCHHFEHYLDKKLTYTNRTKKLSHVRRDLIVIYVFNNGKAEEPPGKFVLSKEDLLNWEYTLSFIGLVLDMPYRNVKFLYNAKGNVICGPWELQHGASYVAVGFYDKFIKCNYKFSEDVSETWKCGIPFIDKTRSSQCYHKNSSSKCWKIPPKWNKTPQNTSNGSQTGSASTSLQDACNCYYDVETGAQQNNQSTSGKNSNTKYAPNNTLKHCKCSCCSQSNPKPK